MLIERKIADKSAILRAMRALAGIEQREIAERAKISLRTVTNAEGGKCSAATWEAMASVYRDAGFSLVAIPAQYGQLVHMIAIDPDSDAIETIAKKKKRRKRA